MSKRRDEDPIEELLHLLRDHLRRARAGVNVTVKSGPVFKKITVTETRYGRHVTRKRNTPNGNSAVTVTLHHWWGESR